MTLYTTYNRSMTLYTNFPQEHDCILTYHGNMPLYANLPQEHDFVY